MTGYGQPHFLWNRGPASRHPHIFTPSKKVRKAPNTQQLLVTETRKLSTGPGFLNTSALVLIVIIRQNDNTLGFPPALRTAAGLLGRNSIIVKGRLPFPWQARRRLCDGFE